MLIDETLSSKSYVAEWDPLACKTCGFLFLLIFLVDSPPSATLRFQHSQPMNTMLVKSSAAYINTN